MKRHLLFSFFLLASVELFAQCVPATDFSGSGIAFRPTALPPVFACTDCGDKEVVLSLQTFADTTLTIELSPGNPLDVTVFADRFRLDSIAGLPAGLSYTTDAAFDTTYDAVENPFGYWINPGDTTTGFQQTTGCISITGSAAAWTAAAGGGPNSDGLYPLTVFLDARAANFSPSAIGGYVGYDVWLTDMGVLLDAFGDTNFTVHGIRLDGNTLDVRASGVGIDEADSEGFTKVMNQPNPFGLSTVITFNSSKAKAVEFAVFNILGDQLAAKRIQANQGVNRFEFDRNGLPAGVYFYSISDGNAVITKKMVIE
ncbi:MAG: T9SS type A sorting domain-containing protein [Flavobacteriales bacterium]|nr:T9SS type A sorting domain-containing protein [Flavobacteriales bacterium]